MDISIIELIVYGLFAYGSLFMLLLSMIREIPKDFMSTIRVIYAIPGMVCAGILASSGPNIVFQAVTTTTRDLNASTVWVETAGPATVTLQSPVWAMFNYMVMIVLLVYIVQQILIFFTTPKDTSR